MTDKRAHFVPSRPRFVLLATLLAFVVSACSTTSATKVTNAAGAAPTATGNNPPVATSKIPHSVAVTEVDLSRATLNLPPGFNISANPQGELGGIAAELRAALIQQGFTVIQAATNSTAADLDARLAKGDFGRAQYVLTGALTRLDWTVGHSEVPGANATSYSASLSMSGDFSLINTDTREVRVAFSAVGVGKDLKLTNAQDTFAPRPAQMFASAQREMIDNAITRLREVGVLTTSAVAPAKTDPALYKKPIGDDLQTLRIYR